MLKKEELKKILINLGEKLIKESASNDTCIKIHIEKMAENWRLFNEELKETIEFLQTLFVEVKSKGLDIKLVDAEKELNEIELEFSFSEVSIQGTNDIKRRLNFLKVQCFVSIFSVPKML